jgi:hypothetical protein
MFCIFNTYNFNIFYFYDCITYFTKIHNNCKESTVRSTDEETAF